MTQASRKVLRRALVALLCVGAIGLTGCGRRYHPQNIHAFNGGLVGKGGAGKKRGIEKSSQAGAFGKTPGFGGDPSAGLFEAPKVAAGKRGAPSSSRVRVQRTVKPDSPFGTPSKSGSFGRSNPFDAR